MQMRYGESKGVAERILHIAHEQCEIPVIIIRTGQIGEPSSSSGGQMHEQEWLLALCRTLRALGALFIHVAAFDWLIFDALAKQISDVVAGEGSRDGYRVFNLKHSDACVWTHSFTVVDLTRRRLACQSGWINWMREHARQVTINSLRL
jgi:thioester reductase-like protein